MKKFCKITSILLLYYFVTNNNKNWRKYIVFSRSIITSHYLPAVRKAKINCKPETWYFEIVIEIGQLGTDVNKMCVENRRC